MTTTACCASNASVQPQEHWRNRTHSDVGELGVGVIAPDDDVLDLGCGDAGAVANLVQGAILGRRVSLYL